MLAAIGVPSLDALIDEVIPASIRLPQPLALPAPESEHQYLRRLTRVARLNKTYRSYIGLGYHDTITPAVILRMVLENPGWYTPYTPYQAEIAQGRLESLLNFQTMVSDLTGMEVANASLLDEATAAAEAMTLLHRVQSSRAPSTSSGAAFGEAGRRQVFLVSDRCLPQTIDVVRSRAEPLEIDVRVEPVDRMTFEPVDGVTPFGVLAAVSGCRRLRAGPAARDRACARGRSARGGWRGSAVAGPADVSRRDGRGRDVRQLAAVRRSPRVRRPACRVLRHAAAPTSGRCRGGSSACPSTRTDTRPTGWRWPRANSTSGARRRRRISAPHRHCSPIWPPCTASITAQTA